MHPRQPPLDPELETIWLAALDHAGVPHEKAILIPLRGNETGDGCAGKCWVPVMDIHEDEVPDEVKPWLEALNEDDTRRGYRVALWTDRSVEGQAALLRHELEHGHQLAKHGVNLNGLHGLAENILRGVSGSGRLYQEIPMETDANAAGSVFAREQFGDHRIDQLLADRHPDSAAFRPSGPPGPIETLMDRMIDFFVAHADLCQNYARATSMNFAGLIGIHSKEGRRVWCERTGRSSGPASLA